MIAHVIFNVICTSQKYITELNLMVAHLWFSLIKSWLIQNQTNASEKPQKKLFCFGEATKKGRGGGWLVLPLRRRKKLKLEKKNFPQKILPLSSRGGGGPYASLALCLIETKKKSVSYFFIWPLGIEKLGITEILFPETINKNLFLRLPLKRPEMLRWGVHDVGAQSLTRNYPIRLP